MGGAEVERLEAAADDGFLQSGQRSNPQFKVGEYPNSLLIILCHPGGLVKRMGVKAPAAAQMDIAVSYHPGRQHTAPASLRGVAEVARVAVLDDMMAAEPFWRRLEDGRCLATPYQRFDLLAAWQHHVGARTGVTPAIVIGFDRAA